MYTPHGSSNEDHTYHIIIIDSALADFGAVEALEGLDETFVDYADSVDAKVDEFRDDAVERVLALLALPDTEVPDETAAFLDWLERD